MKLFPEFLVRLTDRALAKMPIRYRAVARFAVAVAAVALLAFELSRFWLVGRDILAPLYGETFRIVAGQIERGDWLALTIGAALLLLQAGLCVLAFRGLKRLVGAIGRRRSAV